MLKIVSSSDCESPAARSAGNEEPYSTILRSSRFHQTSEGMWCTPGPAPVAIEVRQTGVSEGKTDVACRYSARSARKESAGARPLSTARSNAAGVIPSTTIRTTLLGMPELLVAGERSQAGVALGLRAPESCRESG